MDIYNQILNHPELVLKMKELYTFRVVFIPKKDGGWRPICVINLFLMIFHKILKNRLYKQVKISKCQYAFRK